METPVTRVENSAPVPAADDRPDQVANGRPPESCDNAPSAALDEGRRRPFSWARYSVYLAVFDQGLISAANFAATILLARACGAVALGVYSLGFTLVLLCLAMQDALVISSFTVFFHRLHDERAEQNRYVRGTQLQQLRLAGLLALAMLVAGAVLWLLPELRAVGVCVLGAGVVLPLILFREFVRREWYVRGRIERAVAMNVIVVAGWLAALGVMAWQGVLTAGWAFVALGVACLPALVFQFRPVVESAPATRVHVAKNLRFGSWLVASQIVNLAQNYLVYWVLVFWQGTESTGLFAAAMGVVNMSNPLVIGMCNEFSPRMSAEFARRGPQRLLQVTLRAAALMGVGLLLFGVLLAAAGNQIMTIFFGAEFSDQQATVIALALATLVGALRIVLDLTARTLQRPSASLSASLISVAVNLVACICLVPLYNETGAAYALLLGNVVALITLLGVLVAAFRSFAHGLSQETAGG